MKEVPAEYIQKRHQETALLQFPRTQEMLTPNCKGKKEEEVSVEVHKS